MMLLQRHQHDECCTICAAIDSVTVGSGSNGWTIGSSDIDDMLGLGHRRQRMREIRPPWRHWFICRCGVSRDVGLAPMIIQKIPNKTE